jgi:two-component system sensor histidine kinase HydH
MRRPDGSPAWFEVLAFPLRGADGEIRNVIEMTRDVTRERELELELHRSEKLAAVGRLAAGIAHEVKNPLGVIQSAVDVLANSNRPAEQRDEAADLLRSEVARLSTIVTDFLNYARPRSPVTREQDPAPVIRRSLDAWRRQSSTDGPEVVLGLARDLPERPIDADQLHQALLNLLLNAEQAAGAGGRIVVSADRRDDGRLEITIADDGPGIPAEARSRIFEPFYTTTPRGSGLGLSIVRQVVLAHEGRVEAMDRPGGGAVFRIVL